MERNPLSAIRIAGAFNKTQTGAGCFYVTAIFSSNRMQNKYQGK
jgi:hypothetical protein